MTLAKESAAPPSGQIPDTDWNRFLAIQDRKELERVLEPYFHIRAIQSESDLKGDQSLLILGKQRNYYVRTQSPPVVDNTLPLWLVIENKKIKPLDLSTFRESIQEGRVLCLQPLSTLEPPRSADTEIPSEASTDAPTAMASQSPSNETSEIVELTEAQRIERDQILDMGAFSQLVEAAQRCGIVPGISAIIQVRDSEFRRGRYQQSLQTMESLFSSFTGNAMQRQQRLMREDADIASGRVKMSPREIQAKRVRDNQANDAIERARTRFSRVLDGLRLLLHNQDHSE